MADIVARHAPNDGFHATLIEPLHLFRFSAPNRSFYQSQGAALCLIAQGAKTVTMGEENYFYDPAHFFLVAADLPLIGRVTHASPAAPYLGLHLAIDPTQISELIADAKLLAQAGRAPQRGISVGCADAPLLDAATRLVHLLETPQHIPVLGPMLVREITYGLLTGNAGENLRRIAFASSNAGVMRALNWLKNNYAAPLHIEELAHRVHMSASSFHHQFKAVTAMSPLQYQKQLRLQEARRLMLGEENSALMASERVGYESATQFSREYRRLFGESPQRDVARLRQDSYSEQGVANAGAEFLEIPRPLAPILRNGAENFGVMGASPAKIRVARQTRYFRSSLI